MGDHISPEGSFGHFPDPLSSTDLRIYAKTAQVICSKIRDHILFLDDEYYVGCSLKRDL